MTSSPPRRLSNASSQLLTRPKTTTRTRTRATTNKNKNKGKTKQQQQCTKQQNRVRASRESSVLGDEFEPKPNWFSPFQAQIDTYLGKNPKVKNNKQAASTTYDIKYQSALGRTPTLGIGPRASYKHTRPTFG